MNHKPSTQITLSKSRLLLVLVLASLVGALLAFFLLSPVAPPPSTAVQKIDPPLKETAVQTVASKKTPPAETTAREPVVEKKPVARPEPTRAKPARPTDEFVLRGLLSTAGEPWAARTIAVKLLWLKNKNRQAFLLGKETGMVQATPRGFVYRIVLKPQSAAFTNWNGGVEGNVGRVVAFLDRQRDGRLSPKQDRIIAVSKELVRYRTGRFDSKILNDVQQQNISKAGKGYAIIDNLPLADGQTDWQVVATQSPARLDLNAAETSLPNMYNTFLKRQ